MFPNTVKWRKRKTVATNLVGALRKATMINLSFLQADKRWQSFATPLNQKGLRDPKGNEGQGELLSKPNFQFQGT